MPINTGGGGIGLPSWFQSGSGAPNSVTPAQQGAVYVDTTNGGMFVAIGTTSSDWVMIGGFSARDKSFAYPIQIGIGLDATPMSADGDLDIFCPPGGDVIISDAESYHGSYNGIYWYGANSSSDGQQTANIYVGSSGQYRWKWNTDGHLDAPAYIALKAGVQTTAITSGALPTTTIVSGTGKQILTTRDVNVCVSTSTAGSVVAALSPDNVTYSTLFTKSTGANDVIQVLVPAGWYLKLTATTTSLGTVTYY